MRKKSQAKSETRKLFNMFEWQTLSALSNLKSFETATMALLEPTGATLLGVFLFQEVPASIFVLEAVIVSMGILFIGRNRNQWVFDSDADKEGTVVSR